MRLSFVRSGLSPPARGILAFSVLRRPARRSIPARAGYPSCSSSERRRREVYPRPRGVSAPMTVRVPSAIGLSPPMQGITLTPFAPFAPPRLCVKFYPCKQKNPRPQRRLSQRPGRGLCLSRRKSTRPRCHPRFPPTFRFRRTLCPGGSPRAGDRDAPDNGERDRRSLLAPRAFGPKLWSDVRKRPAARSHHIGRR